MELAELKKLAIGDVSKLAEKITGTRVLQLISDIQKIEPENHDIMDTVLRKNKTIVVPDAKDPKNEAKNKEEIIKVARIPLAIQKLIVQRHVAFLIGGGIQLDANPEGEKQETIVKMLKKTWRANKLDFKSKEIAKTVAIEKECAELWYSEKENGYWDDIGLPTSIIGKMRCMLLSPLRGDELYPIFDNTNDMVAFARGYKIKVDGEEQSLLDIYTEDIIYKLKNTSGTWAQVESVNNPTKKIPIIYHSKERTVYQDVEFMISRLETVISNHGDTNDYNGSPMLFAEGEITGMASKGETGKVFEGETGSKLTYVTWDSAPESIKMEIENLFRLIYTISQTPDITFSEMKNIGQLSGVALKLMFLDAIMKAKEDQDGVFGEFIQRRINFLLNAMGVINQAVVSVRQMELTPIFKDFLPNNFSELVDNFSTLVTAGIISKETALELLDLVKDLPAELQKLKAQLEAEKITIEE